MANTSNYDEQGGARRVIGGSLDVASGGEIDIESGGALKLNGTAVSATAAELNKLDGAASTTTELDYRAITAEIADISSAGQTYICSPFTGNVAKVYSVIEGAIADADATLTVKDKDGNSMGTITVAFSGSGGGDVDNLTPSSNQDVSAGDMIEIETDGGSTNAVAVNLFVVIQIT